MPTSRSTLHTNMGDIVIDLFPTLAPQAVANFTGVSTGVTDYSTPDGIPAATDTAIDIPPPLPSQKNPDVIPESPLIDIPIESGTPFYNGTVFHCIIPGFIIQGGDPTASGFGGPGYEFPDEIHDMKFDRPFLVATAGRGAMSHGSQFIITLRPADHLDGHHSIFGEVTDPASQQVVTNINRMTKGEIAANPPTINSVTVS